MNPFLSTLLKIIPTSKRILTTTRSNKRATLLFVMSGVAVATLFHLTVQSFSDDDDAVDFGDISEYSPRSLQVQDTEPRSTESPQASDRVITIESGHVDTPESKPTKDKDPSEATNTPPSPESSSTKPPSSLDPSPSTEENKTSSNRTISSMDPNPSPVWSSHSQEAIIIHTPTRSLSDIRIH